jgi:DNA modification methylase
VLTDPPYNVPIAGHVSSTGHREFAMASGEMTGAEFKAFTEAWMKPATDALVDGGLIGTFMDWRSEAMITATYRGLDLEHINTVVWVKTNAGMGSLWRSQHEFLPFGKKGTASHTNNVELGKHGRWRSNVWFYPGASTLGSDSRDGLNVHPTVKPVALLEDALLDISDRGEIVLDCFLGSGSTLIAAERIGRRCLGIEIDPIYVDVIIRRWQQLTKLEAVLEATGQTFEQVARVRLNEPVEGERDA